MGRRRKNQQLEVQEKKSTAKTKVKKPQLDLTQAEYDMQKDFLFQVLSVQSKTGKEDRMREYVRSVVGIYNEAHEEKIQWEDDRKGNIYLTKGVAATYPTVVAHIDTVHSIIPDAAWHPIEAGGKIFAIDLRTAKRTGIGGDDKVGVFVALTLLLTKPTIKVALFVEEESGCVGSRQANNDFFSDSAFAMQTDRRGYGDFVNEIMGAELYGKKFGAAIAPILDKYGQTETPGGLTDVYQLVQNGVKCAVFNCSSGYYNPHFSEEYVEIREALLILSMFSDIIDFVWEYGKAFIEERELSSHRRYGWDEFDNHGYGRSGHSYGGRGRYARNNTFYADGRVCTICGRNTVMDWDKLERWCPTCDDIVTDY